MSEEKFTLEQFYKKQAVDLFNGTWDLMDKTDRNHEDDMRMIHMAHASRHHWGAVGTTLHFARGEWQISRAYALVGQGESALYHAKESLRLYQENDIGDFDLAFGFESVARAYAIVGDEVKCNEYLEQAKKATEAIKKDEDKDYVLSELNSI